MNIQPSQAPQGGSADGGGPRHNRKTKNEPFQCGQNFHEHFLIVCTLEGTKNIDCGDQNTLDCHPQPTSRPEWPALWTLELEPRPQLSSCHGFDCWVADVRVLRFAAVPLGFPKMSAARHLSVVPGRTHPSKISGSESKRHHRPKGSDWAYFHVTQARDI